MSTAAPADVVRHIGDDNLPWADAGDGIEMKILRVDAANGVWVIRNRFQPGVQLPVHRHTGAVDGFTLAGRWKYAEYDFESTAGSFIREPAGSVHTLCVPADGAEPADVLFVIEGVLLYLDDEGNISWSSGGPDTLEAYYALLDAQGTARPDGVLV